MKPHIGLSIYPPNANIPELRLAVEAMKARDWRVSLLSFHWPHDFNAFEAIDAERIKLSEDRIHSVYSDIDLHCGMRYHGHILSVVYNLPFVGISVSNKIDAICDLFGMPVLKTFTAPMLVEAIETTLPLTIDPLKRKNCTELAEKNFTLLAPLLKRT
jgi:polysaccharide pyruvyl transferase WcaK-like protein